MLHQKSRARADVHLQDAGSPEKLPVKGAETDLYSDQAVLHTCSAALPMVSCCGNDDRLIQT